MSVWLSAGISRCEIVIVRSVSFALMLGAIAMGIAAGTFGPFAFLEYLSPFTYSNMSRALVPGMGANWLSMLGVVLVAAAMVAISTRMFLLRDIGDVVRGRVHESHQHVASRRSFTVRSLLGDGLYHSWVAMLTWSLGGAALVGVMVSLEPAAMDAWSYFDVLFPAG